MLMLRKKGKTRTGRGNTLCRISTYRGEVNLVILIQAPRVLIQMKVGAILAPGEKESG